MYKYRKKAITVGILLIIALVSAFGIAKPLSNPRVFSKQIQYLDEKKTTVIELAGASTAASLAVSALPGDFATPIAEKLTDLSGYFMLITGAIFLEKYLISITLFITFRWLIPAAMVFLIAFILTKNHSFHEIAKKLVAFGLAISFIIPASVSISKLIEETYQSSADNAIHKAIEDSKDMETDEESVDSTAEENLSWFQKIWRSAKNAVSAAADAIIYAPKRLTEMCNHFIEAVAVLLITSCAIPILVLFAFLWIIKLFLGVNMMPGANTLFKNKWPFQKQNATVSESSITPKEEDCIQTIGR